MAEKELDIPTYWIRPPRTLPATAGMQRFVWDLHYPAPEGGRRMYPISAIYRDTPSMPQGPVVLPGEYTVKLIVDGRNLTRPLTVKMDPRVNTPPEGVAQQFAIAMRCHEGMHQIHETLAQIRHLRTQLKEARDRAAQNPVTEAIAALDRKAATLEGEPLGPRARFGGGMRGAGRGVEKSLTRLSGELGGLLALVEGADATPTMQAVAASDDLQRTFTELLGRWNELKEKDLKVLNEKLREAKLPIIAAGK